MIYIDETISYIDVCWSMIDAGRGNFRGNARTVTLHDLDPLLQRLIHEHCLWGNAAMGSTTGHFFMYRHGQPFNGVTGGHPSWGSYVKGLYQHASSHQLFRDIDSKQARFLYVVHQEYTHLAELEPAQALQLRRYLARCMLTSLSEWENTYTQQMDQHLTWRPARRQRGEQLIATTESASASEHRATSSSSSGLGGSNSNNGDENDDGNYTHSDANDADSPS